MSVFNLFFNKYTASNARREVVSASNVIIPIVENIASYGKTHPQYQVFCISLIHECSSLARKLCDVKNLSGCLDSEYVYQILSAKPFKLSSTQSHKFQYRHDIQDNQKAVAEVIDLFYRTIAETVTDNELMYRFWSCPGFYHHIAAFNTKLNKVIRSKRRKRKNWRQL